MVSPTIAGYNPDLAKVDSVQGITAETENQVVTVTYRNVQPTPQVTPTPIPTPTPTPQVTPIQYRLQLQRKPRLQPRHRLQLQRKPRLHMCRQKFQIKLQFQRE